MSNDHEAVLSALFSHLQAAVAVNFTGNGAANSAVISNVSSFTGIFTGLPVFGPGVVRGATIQNFDPLADTITLDQPIGTPSTGGAFSTGFLTTGRRVKYWTDVSEQPALFLRHTADEDRYEGEMPDVQAIEAEIWIYSRAGEDPDVAPDITLNNLVRAIRESLAFDDSGTQQFTLGGKVYWCRIEGRSEYDPGDVDSQSKAVIPIKILVP